MKQNKLIVKTVAFVFTCFVMVFGLKHACYAEGQEILGREGKVMSFSFTELKDSDGSEKVFDYSGKTVIWQGEITKNNSTEAYFEYTLKLDSGDKLKVLSGRGIRHKVGDYVQVKGMILVKEGRFSHLVLNEMSSAVKPKPELDPGYSIPGLIPLKASNKIISNRIYNWIRYYNPGVSSKNASFIANRIVYYCKKYRQDPFLVTSLMSVESAFNMSAISPKGAIGLGQLMPGTASMLGVNPYNPDENIEGSIRYLMWQMNRWQKTDAPVALALASYNAGPGAVAKYGGIPPYRETIEYVNIVCALYYKVRKKKQ